MADLLGKTKQQLTIRLGSALAKSGRSVLHVDEYPYYGDKQAALSLKELITWTHGTLNDERYVNLELGFPAYGQNEPPPDLLRRARSYSISLCPTLLCAVSPFVDTLVKSGVAKHSEFKLLNAIAIYESGQLKRTAATKEDIFNDNNFSLIDKRKLVKFLLFASSNFEETDLVKSDDWLLPCRRAWLSLMTQTMAASPSRSSWHRNSHSPVT